MINNNWRAGCSTGASCYYSISLPARKARNGARLNPAGLCGAKFALSYIGPGLTPGEVFMIIAPFFSQYKKGRFHAVFKYDNDFSTPLTRNNNFTQIITKFQHFLQIIMNFQHPLRYI